MSLVRRVAAGGFAVMAVIVACNGSNPVEVKRNPTLPLIASYPLSFTEPSGLAVDETGTRLWAVSNHPEKVHELDLTGTVVKTLKYDGHDLEAVAYDPRDKTLWVAEENRREVVHLDLEGNVLSTYATGLTGEQNSGLEGLCLTDSGRVYALNEKHPGLFVTLKSDLTIDTLQLLTFAGDYSGMEYDVARSAFWITSDQSRALYLWSPTGGVLQAYDLQLPKPEGVAFDAAANRFYIVSDSTNTLYVFDGPASP